MSQYKPRGLYFEDFKMGQRFYSVGRTITEDDIVSFAGLSGDYNQIHTDAEFARIPLMETDCTRIISDLNGFRFVMQRGLIEGTFLL